METKKSYNPFTMWGSWISLLIGTSILVIPFILKINIDWIVYLSPVSLIDAVDCHEAGCGLISIMTLPVVFFIYGCIINSLVLKFTK